MSGNAVSEGGLMIDLSAMCEVRVDPERRRAVVGGGATWAEMDGATQAHGLAVTGGTISHTGVAGLTLGGGMGWMTKQHGLSCDNLVSADVVLADGRRVHASSDEHPDLFWAIRGGGGNFGVVTAFEFALHPVGPEVHLGLFFWGIDDSVAALALIRDVVHALPDDTSSLVAAALSAPPLPAVPEQHHFALGHALMVVGFGSGDDHARTVAPIREQLAPLFEIVTPIPYAELQLMLDASAPWRTADPALLHAPGRNQPGPGRSAGRPELGTVAVGRAATARPVRRRLRQLHRRGRRRAGPRRVRAAEIRTIGTHQGRIRPGEHPAPQRQHQTRLNRGRDRPPDQAGWMSAFATQAGGMLALCRKTFVGSYSALISRSRSNLAGP